MGDPARANMLCALKNEGDLTATELAHVAGVAPSTASEHLAKLTRALMIAVRRQGRHRYYRLARVEVAGALESLEALAVTAAPRHRPRAPRDDSIRFARSCYDHLAGRLGVELYRSLVRLGYLKVTDGGCVLRKKGGLNSRISASIWSRCGRAGAGSPGNASIGVNGARI